MGTSPVKREAPPVERPEDLPYPARIQALGAKITELTGRVDREIGTLREALTQWAQVWMRDVAKKVAIAQNAVTLGLGRPRIGQLKREIDERAAAVPAAVAREFTVARYADVTSASSGQVSAVIERRFEDGIRRILQPLGPVLERAGYHRDEHWVEVEPAEGQRTRYPHVLELPPDLHDLIGRIAEAITDQKVAEAKITYYDKQRDKEIAAELWEQS